ncbi:MAG: NADH-quinone oxidoreductase subunit J [Rhodobacteraceae bacterium]|nr:MAG: NADH-quinone oxidoreductase subunit J [Paracoccaceae bacterium]
MGIADYTFYAFAVTILTSGLMVTVSRNPVHAVLWLILAFLSGAGFFVLLGAEFLAMLLIIVYLGAVIVLFLFVVMMLDVDFASLKGEVARYFPIAALVGLVLLMQMSLLVGSWQAADGALALRQAPTPDPDQIHNTKALGLIIYDQYFLVFQVSGLVLLVAMIGAIVLTLRHRKDVKRQDVTAQMHRDPAKALELKDIKPGQGLG